MNLYGCIEQTTIESHGRCSQWEFSRRSTAVGTSDSNRGKSREGHVSTGFVSRAAQYVYRKVEYRLKKKKTEKVKFEAVG